MSNIRYADLRKMDVTNGEGIAVSLFTQGCPHHCKGCWNETTWDFNGGKEWTPEIKEKFVNDVTSAGILKDKSLLPEIKQFIQGIVDEITPAKTEKQKTNK